jgi:hypothetical protein
MSTRELPNVFGHYGTVQARRAPVKALVAEPLVSTE